MKILVSILLSVCGLLVTWIFLPEKVYEAIASISKIEFSIYDINEVTSQKIRSLFSIAFGFCLLYSGTFKIFRKTNIYFIAGFVLILIGFFIGILANANIFKSHHAYTVEVSIHDCLKMWIILPTIVLMLLLGKFILEFVQKEKLNNNYST